MSILVYAMDISSLPDSPVSKCIYENIRAKCGELIISSTAYGEKFDVAKAAIGNNVDRLGGKLLTVDSVLNRIVAHFPHTVDLIDVKRQLEKLPEINSIAYSPESTIDSFGN